jgi:hypothetical protein
MLAPVLRTIWDQITIEEKNKSIRYALHNAVTLVVIGIQVSVVRLVGVSYFDAILFSVALYWLLFDFMLNYVRNKPVLSYYGDFTDEKNLSLIEKYVYAKLNWKVLLLIKITVFLIAVAFYG